MIFNLQNLFLILSIIITLSIVYFVKYKMQDKHRTPILTILWIFIITFSYLTFTSINDEIKFDETKNDRYQLVIKNLIDIRDSQLAHKDIKGSFQSDWSSLVQFIENDSFTITQRRDSSIIDKELTKRYGGVKTFKDIVIIDTLGFISVKDSLFKYDERYRNMMKVPFSENDNVNFELSAGFINENNINVPVFEAKVKKSVILHDQAINLILKENEVQSVDGVNGSTLKIGSMVSANTNGNWPKNYSKNK